MLKDDYSFPAILYFDDDGISIDFPDLPGCLPCAKTTEEAIKNAKEALGLHLWGMERDNDEIPEPSSITELRLEDKSIPLIVDVFMPPIREKINNKLVQKTLFIPSWLDSEAEHAGVNLSQILQNALKEHLKLAE